MRTQQTEIAQLRKRQEQTTATLEARLARIENGHKNIHTASAQRHQPTEGTARVRTAAAEVTGSALSSGAGQ